MDEAPPNQDEKAAGGSPSSQEQAPIIRMSVPEPGRKKTGERNPGDALMGKCKAWRTDKGFGFVTLDDGGPDLFVHQTAIETSKSGFRCLSPGTLVEITYGVDKFGKPCATKVTGPGGGPIIPFGSKTEAEQALRHASWSGQQQQLSPLQPPSQGITRLVPLSQQHQLQQLSPSGRVEGQIITGVCKVWHPDKGFGFVIADDGGSDIFVHQTTVQVAESFSGKPAFKCVLPGTRVELIYRVDKNGKAGCARITGPNGELLPAFPNKQDATRAIEQIAMGASPDSAAAGYSIMSGNGMQPYWDGTPQEVLDPYGYPPQHQQLPPHMLGVPMAGPSGQRKRKDQDELQQIVYQQPAYQPSYQLQGPPSNIAILPQKLPRGHFEPARPAYY